jgi:hypothetical protein
MNWTRINGDNKFTKSLTEPPVVQGVAPSLRGSPRIRRGRLGKDWPLGLMEIMIRPLSLHDEHDASEISQSSRLPTR